MKRLSLVILGVLIVSVVPLLIWAPTSVYVWGLLPVTAWALVTYLKDKSHEGAAKPSDRELAKQELLNQKPASQAGAASKAEMRAKYATAGGKWAGAFRAGQSLPVLSKEKLLLPDVARARPRLVEYFMGMLDIDLDSKPALFRTMVPSHEKRIELIGDLYTQVKNGALARGPEEAYCLDVGVACELKLQGIEVAPPFLGENASASEILKRRLESLGCTAEEIDAELAKSGVTTRCNTLLNIALRRQERSQ